MLKQVSFHDIAPVDFEPQAVLRRPVTYFSDRLGYKFEKDADDLDDYESAFFKLDNSFPFALVHYQGNPEDTTTIYFGRGMGQDAVAVFVSQILHDLDLPFADVVWISRK